MQKNDKFDVIESLTQYRDWCREMMVGAKPLSATKIQFATAIWGVNRMLKLIDVTRNAYNRMNCRKR